MKSTMAEFFITLILWAGLVNDLSKSVLLIITSILLILLLIHLIVKDNNNCGR